TERPRMRTEAAPPWSLQARPLRWRSNVDLPDPEGPIKATISPVPTCNLRLDSACLPLKLLVSPSTRITVSMCLHSCQEGVGAFIDRNVKDGISQSRYGKMMF